MKYNPCLEGLKQMLRGHIVSGRLNGTHPACLLQHTGGGREFLRKWGIPPENFLEGIASPTGNSYEELTCLTHGILTRNCLTHTEFLWEMPHPRGVLTGNCLTHGEFLPETASPTGNFYGELPHPRGILTGSCLTH